MRLIRFITKVLGLRAIRRRRLQKLRSRVQCLRQQLALKDDLIQGLTQQRDGFQAAFFALQESYKTKGVAAKVKAALISQSKSG